MFAFRLLQIWTESWGLDFRNVVTAKRYLAVWPWNGYSHKSQKQTHCQIPIWLVYRTENKIGMPSVILEFEKVKVAEWMDISPWSYHIFKQEKQCYWTMGSMMFSNCKFFWCFQLVGDKTNCEHLQKLFCNSQTKIEPEAVSKVKPVLEGV